ncbi:ribonuclease E inhibitor RraB [Thalassospira xiamenensis]|nr:ribonuclease E inhibitor RraB [Thalassospira xiamenensis]
MQTNDLEDLLAQSRETVAALIEDGAPAENVYIIEHHLACTDFTKLEKAAVELVKLNYHVDDADEFELDDGSRYFAFVAVGEASLDNQVLDAQTKEVTKVAQLTGVEYDGWGTYFGEEDDDEDSDDDGDDFSDD